MARGLRKQSGGRERTWQDVATPDDGIRYRWEDYDAALEAVADDLRAAGVPGMKQVYDEAARRVRLEDYAYRIALPVGERGRVA